MPHFLDRPKSYPMNSFLQEMMPALFRWFTKNNGQFGAEMCCESSPQEISKAPGTMASARSEGLEDEKGPVGGVESGLIRPSVINKIC